MSRIPTTLQDLREAIVARGGRRVLHWELDEVADGLEAMVDAEQAPSLLFELADEVDGFTLEQVLSDDRVERAYADRLPPRERERFGQTLMQWVGGVVANDPPQGVRLDVPPGAPRVQEPPAQVRALVRWAAQHGVESWLDEPGWLIEPWMTDHDWVVHEALRPRRVRRGDDTAPTPSVRDCVQGNLPLDRALGTRATTDAVFRAARAMLEHLAQQRLAREHRRQLWAREPETPRLAALSARLKEALAHAETGARAHEPVPAQEVPLSVTDDPPAVVATLQDGAGRYDRVDAAVELTGFEHGAVQTRCGCAVHRDDDGRCRHARAVIEWTLDAVHAPEHFLHAQVLAATSTPTWHRVIDELVAELEDGVARAEQTEQEAGEGAEAGTIERTEAAAERIVWRVTPRTGLDVEPDVQLALQKRTRQGKWSAGKKLGREGLDRPELLGREDFAVLGALRARRGSRGALAVLRELADHPRLYRADRPGEPLTVRPATPQLVLLEQSGGGEGASEQGPAVRIELRLGGVSIPLDALAPGAESPANVAAEQGGGAVPPHLLLAFDEAAGTLRFAELDERAARFLMAWARYPAGLLPREAADRIVALLPRLQPSVELELPASLRGRLRPEEPGLVARLAPRGEGLRVELRVRPLSDGPTYLPGNGPQLVLGTGPDGVREHVQRDFDDERVRAATLAREAGLLDETAGARATDAEGFDLLLAEADAALDALATLRAHAEAGELELEWPEDELPARVVGTARAGSLRVRVRRLEDWFGLSGGVEVDGERVPLRKLLGAVRAGRRYVRLGPGRFARIEEALRERLARAGEVVFEHDRGLAVGVAAAERVRELAGSDDAIDADRQWRETLSRMREAESLDPEPPAELRAELRDYQRDGYRWLRRLASWGAGGCLADEMGLGKTVQTLAVLLDRAELGPALVVAPTSVCAGWLSESERFAPSLNRVLYHGPDRAARLEGLGPGDLVVTSYDVLARDAELLGAIRFASLVLDEAQAIKNARTRRARAARSLSASWRIALTGTPIENHLGELWSLFRVVSPGLLGGWQHFRARFAVPIERDGDLERREALAQMVRPFLLRRTKAQVEPELPERTDVVRPVELSARERAMYDAVRQQALASLMADAVEAADARGAGSGDGTVEAPKGRIEVLAAITRLRRLACHPRLEDPETSVPSSKLAAFLDLVDTLRSEGHRALVFSQFTSHLALVRKALDARRIPHLYLDGSTPAGARAELVQRFQDGEAPLFLISLKAGGTGLNLTAADYVVHLDPWWNPAVEDQASDRAHRIGQTRPVTVVRLVAQGTIEETVVALHEDKRDLAEGILAGGELAGKASTEELLALVRGDAEVPPAE